MAAFSPAQGEPDVEPPTAMIEAIPPGDAWWCYRTISDDPYPGQCYRSRATCDENARSEGPGWNGKPCHPSRRVAAITWRNKVQDRIDSAQFLTLEECARGRSERAAKVDFEHVSACTPIGETQGSEFEKEIVPGGTGWFCSTFLVDRKRMDACSRTKDGCVAAVAKQKGTGGKNFSMCKAQSPVFAVTTMRQDLYLFASKETCESWLDYLPGPSMCISVR